MSHPRQPRPRRPWGPPRTLQTALGSLLGLAGLTALGCGSEVTVVRGSGGAGGDETWTTTTTTPTSSTTTTLTTSTSSSTGSGGDGGFGGAPPIPALVEHDLGSVPFGEMVGFDVPAGTISLTAIAHASWQSAEIYFDYLYAPSGTALVESQYIPGTAYSFYWYGDVTLQVPQDDDGESMPLAPGLWQFVIGSSQGTAANLSVWHRQTVDGQFHGGVIDFNVFIVPGAAQQSYMRDVLDGAFSGFAGLDLGTVTFYDLDPQYAVLDDYNWADVFRETEVATTRPAINVMVVQSYEGSLSDAGGFSMGIPALPLHHGTYQSGMSMLVWGDYWVDELVLRHEVGHQAGLFHTTELFDPQYGDPLEDTPTCGDAIEQDPYGCPDGNNLMFPYGPLGEFELSADQLTVVRASAMYRGRVEEGGLPAYPLPPENGRSAPAADAGGDDAAVPDREAESARRNDEQVPVASRRSRPPRADRAPWSTELAPAAAAYLQALWEPTGRAGDPYARLARLGGADPDVMLEVAQHPAAPALVRARAAQAAGRLGPSARVVEELVRMAADPSAGKHERIGALRGLANARPERARRLAAELERDADGGVAAVARRISR